MLNTTLYGITVVPAILGVVQVAKEAGLPGRAAPLLALALGLAAGIGQALTSHLDYPAAIATGLALGLSASGLYSGAIAVVNSRDAVPSASENQTPAASTSAPAPAMTKTGETTTTTTDLHPELAIMPPTTPRRHSTRSATGKFTPTTPPTAPSDTPTPTPSTKPQPPSGSPPTSS